MSKKSFQIFLNALPIIFMVILIPFIRNDYLLTLAYLAVIAVTLFIKYESKDFVFLVFGFFIMMFFEYFFLATKVEKFNRVSFLGVMPMWLPFLWAYGFVSMKRAIEILK
jgi:hypothetical protein